MDTQHLSKSEIKKLTTLYIERAQVFFRLHEFKKCLESLYKIISINDEVHPDMYYNIACCLRNLGIYKMAIENINKAMVSTIEIIPEYFIERGLTYFMLEKYEIAIRDLEDGLLRIVLHPEAMRTLALCYEKLGKTQKSICVMLLAAMQGDLEAIKLIQDMGGKYETEDYCSLIQSEQNIQN
jgi:tetratricopeptide (TPR) repeat protein